MKSLRKVLFSILFFSFGLKFINYFIHLPYNVPSRLKNGQPFKTKEFQIELKNLNVSYNYFGNGKNECHNRTDVLIFTLSTPKTQNLRMGIRNSWQNDVNLRYNYTHKFFIGWTWNKTLQKSLQTESEKYGDIIFTNIIDDYSNLTLKINSIYQWQQHFCPSVKYLLRADEDTVIDISRFQYWIDGEFEKIRKSTDGMVIFGNLIENSPTIRNLNDKWYASYETWNKTFYPSYMHGACHLLTSKAVRSILKEATKHSFIAIDDAFYTGIVAEASGILRIDSKKHFYCGNPFILLNQRNYLQCDGSGVPLIFAIFDETGEIEITSHGYRKELKKLKQLNCSLITWELAFVFLLLCSFFNFLHRIMPYEEMYRK